MKIKSSAGSTGMIFQQVTPVLAFGKGKSSFTVSEVSSHILTNIWIMEQFLPLKFKIKRNLVQVEGVGLSP